MLLILAIIGVLIFVPIVVLLAKSIKRKNLEKKIKDAAIGYWKKK
jgi:hypothetical protein